MTREEFIKNFNEDNKLQKIKELETMSIEEYIAGPEKELLEEKGSTNLIIRYNHFVDLYEKYANNTITNEEQKELNDSFSFYERSKKYMIDRIKRDIENFKRDLEFFCEIPNLPFEEWLNTYYVPHLYKLPNDLMNDDYKQDRMLMVDVFNNKITFDEYKAIIKNPDDLFYAKDYIKHDYYKYLDTQITFPTIKMEFAPPNRFLLYGKNKK